MAKKSNQTTEEFIVPELTDDVLMADLDREIAENQKKGIYPKPKIKQAKASKGQTASIATPAPAVAPVAQANNGRLKEISLTYDINVLEYRKNQLEAERDRTEMGFWSRWAPTWLGGASQEEVAKNDAYQQKLDQFEKQLDAELDAKQEEFKKENEKSGHANSVTDIVLPDLVGGRTRYELEQGVDFQPNWWQRNMPTWLGGWEDEKLALAKTAGEMAGYIDRPNFWQRRMPTWLGGWRNEEVTRLDNLAQSHGLLPQRPNLWERYMPTWLGGASQEEVARYDQAREAYDKKHPQMSGYKRHMPTWLMGASKEEVEKFDKAKDLNREVLKNVTVGSLLEAGFTDQQIDAMQMRIDRYRIQKYAQEGAQNPLGLLNRFHRVSTPLEMTQQDLGVTKEQMQVISKISQRG